MSHTNQFDVESHPLYVPAVLLKTPWIDTSWGNDSCPSFWNKEKGLKVFVEFDADEDREDHNCFKYAVLIVDEEGQYIHGGSLGDEQFETEEELIRHLAK
jgi:hypothetical protein